MSLHKWDACQRLTLRECDFEFIGFDECACEPESGHEDMRILTTIAVNGTCFHVEGIAVEYKDGMQRAVCLSWEDRLDEFSATFAPDKGFETVELFGRDYILVCEPYGR